MRLLLVPVLAAAAALCAPAVASADKITFFKTPSGNIGCAREHIGHTDMLRCDLMHIRHRAHKPKGCKFGWGNAFGMSGHGRARALCVSDSVLEPHAKVLRYGVTKRYGPFRCTSKTSGLRCSNRSRHGFVLNRSRYRFF